MPSRAADVSLFSRTPLYLLLAATLFMRAFLPQGYMAERASSGAIAVTLCNSDGVHLIPLKEGAPAEEDRQRAEPPCAFAGLASPLLPLFAAPELPPRAMADPLFARYAAAQVLGPGPRFLPPARAPPLPA